MFTYVRSFFSQVSEFDTPTTELAFRISRYAKHNFSRLDNCASSIEYINSNTYMRCHFNGKNIITELFESIIQARVSSWLANSTLDNIKMAVLARYHVTGEMQTPRLKRLIAYRDQYMLVDDLNNMWFLNQDSLTPTISSSLSLLYITCFLISDSMLVYNVYNQLHKERKLLVSDGSKYSITYSTLSSAIFLPLESIESKIFLDTRDEEGHIYHETKIKSSMICPYPVTENGEIVGYEILETMTS